MTTIEKITMVCIGLFLWLLFFDQWHDYQWSDRLYIEFIEETTKDDRKQRLQENQQENVTIHHCDHETSLIYSYLYESSGYDKEIVMTMIAENDKCDRQYITYNKNWSSDHGIAQLNIAHHYDFIASDKYKNPLYQVDYLIKIRYEWKARGVMRRNAHKVRRVKAHLYQFNK